MNFCDLVVCAGCVCTRHCNSGVYMSYGAAAKNLSRNRSYLLKIENYWSYYLCINGSEDLINSLIYYAMGYMVQKMPKLGSLISVMCV